jgi:hypothetical protein
MKTRSWLVFGCAALFLILGLKGSGGQVEHPLTDKRFCADANGDGKLDLSDAVTVLNYLFLGQGAPYCVAQDIALTDFVRKGEPDAISSRMLAPESVSEDKLDSGLRNTLENLKEVVASLQATCCVPKVSWHLFEDPTKYAPNDPDHSATGLGDPGYFWYEPCAHGFTEPFNEPRDFATLRNCILAKAGLPLSVTGTIDFIDSTSDVLCCDEMTFSYLVCDFYIPTSENLDLYELQWAGIDDGIRVILNGRKLLDARTGSPSSSGAFPTGSLSPILLPGQLNTLIVIVVDNQMENKGVLLSFLRDGIMVK